MRKLITTLLCSFSLASPTLYADTVYVPIGQQGSQQASIERPQQGMSKDQVQEKFGEPKDWDEPIGDPPISRWVYEKFTVYFEYDRVIHSVLIHAPINH